MQVHLKRNRSGRGVHAVVNRFQCEKRQFIKKMKMEVFDSETVRWLSAGECLEPVAQCLLSPASIVVSAKKNHYRDDCFFATSLMDTLVEAKTLLDPCNTRILKRARGRYDAFECVGPGHFANRAAIKLANINYLVDRELTTTTTSEVDHQHLHYADICAGPGGFSEFIRESYRNKPRVRVHGYGLTLRGSDDFIPRCVEAAANFTFTAIYGRDGRGDIYNEETRNAFTDHVLRATNGRGVRFALADGGFDVRGRENIQELLSQKLFLCETTVALSVLDAGGCLVLKLFDIFSKFSVGLLYLIRCCFEKFCLLKPYSSRPANSERYLVCKLFRGRESCSAVIDHLTVANTRITNETDVTELLPTDVVVGDVEFSTYINGHVEEFTGNQVKTIGELMMYYKDDAHSILDNLCVLKRQPALELAKQWLDV